MKGVGHMEKQARPKILLYQSLGFLTIICLIGLGEAFNLAALVFKDHPVLGFHTTILAMLFTLVVWFFVTRSTRRVLDRIRYLEGFLKVCAWCHQIDHKGAWMPIEEFLRRGFDTPTSHGICPECLKKQKSAAERTKQLRKAPIAAPQQSAA
jgi:hypothetical protein